MGKQPQALTEQIQKQCIETVHRKFYLKSQKKPQVHIEPLMVCCTVQYFIQIHYISTKYIVKKMARSWFCCYF